MKAPTNKFKARLMEGAHQIGLWCSLAHSYSTEIVAGAGYDWLLLDMEHAPTDMETLLSQLQAMAAYPVSPIVRPPSNDPVIIKRILDLGVQTLLIPYVQNPNEAVIAAGSMYYPPQGIRGVSTKSRATDFGRLTEYAKSAAEQMCCIVQIETVEALKHLEDIANVTGIDALFIGPADLAASLGHLGNADHPEVLAAIDQALERSKAVSKPIGFITDNKALARYVMRKGTSFTAVGLDVALLSKGADELRQTFSQQ